MDASNILRIFKQVVSGFRGTADRCRDLKADEFSPKAWPCQTLAPSAAGWIQRHTAKSENNQQPQNQYHSNHCYAQNT